MPERTVLRRRRVRTPPQRTQNLRIKFSDPISTKAEPKEHVEQHRHGKHGKAKEDKRLDHIIEEFPSSATESTMRQMANEARAFVNSAPKVVSSNKALLLAITADIGLGIYMVATKRGRHVAREIGDMIAGGFGQIRQGLYRLEPRAFPAGFSASRWRMNGNAARRSSAWKLLGAAFISW
jgi:hypothetical protein